MEEGEGGLTGNKEVASFCAEQGREREADRWGQAAQYRSMGSNGIQIQINLN
jgi:hypothetical protein